MRSPPAMAGNLHLQNLMMAVCSLARKRSSVGKKVERPGFEDGFATA